MKTTKLNVLGLYSNNGVSLYPFYKKKLFNLVGNLETRSSFITPDDIQWKLNFNNIPLWKKPIKIKEKIDIIISMPNCGHSSLLAYSRGKKLGNGKEDYTITIFCKTLLRTKPKVFLFENLPSLFKSFPENEFDKLFKDYYLIKFIVPMSVFGNSQISRERLIIIGLRKNQSIFKPKHFRLPKELPKLKTVRELESNLIYPNPSLCHVRESDETIVCMEKDFKKLNLKQIRKIWNSPEYQDRKKWDATTTGKGKMKNLPGVYRNLADSYPLTARKQNRQFNSKGYIMSPRELARVQGIPDNFKLWYDPNRDQYSINKARVTTTKCAPYELGQWFYKCVIKAIKQNGNTKNKKA